LVRLCLPANWLQIERQRGLRVDVDAMAARRAIETETERLDNADESQEADVRLVLQESLEEFSLLHRGPASG
jgi:hypothetical protein